MSKFTFALAALAAIGTATVATADSSYFGLETVQEETSRLDIGTVRAGSDAVVEIYDFHGGEIGDLLGTEAVNAGANSNVFVNLGRTARNDVIAILKAGDQVLASQEFEIED